MPDTQNTSNSSNPPLRGGQGFPADNRDGTPTLTGKDEFTKQYEIDRLTRKHKPVVVGNLADLHRIGAALAVGESLPTGILPADVADAKDAVTPAQASARKGEWNVETERAGLVDAPPAPIPAENKEPDSVDPGSQSPVVVAKGSSTPQSATKTK
jgi:hypothetical protein